MSGRSTASEFEAELHLVGELLGESAIGRRVALVGSTAKLALELARAGFRVVWIQGSASAAAEARVLSERAGLEIRFEVVDPRADEPWPVLDFDAIVCLEFGGWGSDSEARRFLRRMRGRLAPEGLLLLSDLNLFWWLNHQADADLQLGDGRRLLNPSFDPLNGICDGMLARCEPDGSSSEVRFERRLYTCTEWTSLLRQVGFTVEAVHADFDAKARPSPKSRSIQFCCSRLATPPGSLAVSSWRTPDRPGLDLRYAPDEAPWLSPSPMEVWKELIESEAQEGAEAIGHYPVDDPYGGERAAGVASRHFGCRLSPLQVTLGPGVTSLLHDLSGLADGGLILSPQLVHPDVSAWGAARGFEVLFVDGPASADRFIDQIRRLRPSLVHLDRPLLFDGLMTLDDLRRIALEAGKVRAFVLVDESPATYLGPARSGVTLIPDLDNLVVARGLTKAYSWGGLRIGFAYASPGVSERVRALVPPLQVGELGFRAALRLLEAGDIFGTLRQQVRRMKPQAISLLTSLGLEVFDAHPELPWVVVPDPSGAASQKLDTLGIRGLRFVPSPALRRPFPERLLLFTPLSDQRMARLHELLQAG